MPSSGSRESPEDNDLRNLWTSYHFYILYHQQMNTLELLKNSKFWSSYGNFDARSDAAQDFLAENGLKLVPQTEVNSELSIAEALVDFEGGDGSRGAWDRYPRPVFNYIVAIDGYEAKKDALEEEHYQQRVADEKNVSGRITDGKRGYFIDLRSAALDCGRYKRLSQKEVKAWEAKTNLTRDELVAHIVSKIKRIYSAYGEARIEWKQ